MATICLYFQIHQPLRIRPYSVFEIGKHTPYFDQAENRRILELKSRESYEPALKIIENLIKTHEGKFRVCFSLTGTAIEQLLAWQPSVIERLKSLAKTGAVEFLAETYYHSMSFEFSRREFLRQVRLHTEKIESLFDLKPRIFRHTGLLFHNPMAYLLEQHGYSGLLTEGEPQLLSWQDPNQLYHAAHMPGFPIILRNVNLSEDISDRFSDTKWEHFPLTSQNYLEIIERQSGQNVCLGLNLETFGSKHKTETGILDFLEDFPTKLIENGHEFLTPSGLIAAFKPEHKLDLPYAISWKDDNKDSEVWIENSRQREALRKIYEMESLVKESNNNMLIQNWSYLQSVDHFYNMSKMSAEQCPQEPHNLGSEQNAYIHFMNLIADFQISLREV